MNLVDRINLSMTHTRLSPLCFDRSFNRKSTETLTPDELRQLYEQSRTETERNQCFKSNVLDRLLLKNFNEVVRLYMDPKNKLFVANDKILHSLKGKFILEGERVKFSEIFIKKFLFLLERAEGTILLGFVDVEQFGANNTKRCARILSSKLRRGQRAYCIDFGKTMGQDFGEISCAQQIYNCMYEHPWLTNTIFYRSYSLIDINRCLDLCFDKRNIVANIKELIDMINGDSLLHISKQHLRKVLALLEATELAGGWRDIDCNNCGSQLDGAGDLRALIEIDEPAWSNCSGCELK